MSLLSRFQTKDLITIDLPSFPESCKECLMKQYNFRKENKYHICYLLDKLGHPDPDVTSYTDSRSPECILHRGSELVRKEQHEELQ